MNRSIESTATIAIVAAMLVTACGLPTPTTAMMDGGRDAYLCCTTRFNLSREASDANYDYRDKVVFPAGTRVRVLSVTSTKALVVPEGETKSYSIEFRYGRKAMRPGDYFGRLFVADDPLAHLAHSPDLQTAVRTGQLRPGMTKWEAVTARGYPPAHRTPSTEADDWLYYTGHKTCQQVRFVDGRLASIDEVLPPR